MAWTIFAAYVLIRTVIRPSDEGLFMMIITPIGASAFMVAFFSPVFTRESDAVERGYQKNRRPPVRRAEVAKPGLRLRKSRGPNVAA